MIDGTTTARGVVARIAKDRKGVHLLPEGGGEAYWINFGEYSPECPEALALGTPIEATYTKYGKRYLIDAIKILDGDAPEVKPDPKPEPGSKPEVWSESDLAPAKSTPAAPSSNAELQPRAAYTMPRPEPIVIHQAPTGPDLTTLRLYARIHAMDLAAKVLRYNLPDEITDEELMTKAATYEQYFLDVLGEAVSDVMEPAPDVEASAPVDESESQAGEEKASPQTSDDASDNELGEFMGQSRDFLKILKGGDHHVS